MAPRGIPNPGRPPTARQVYALAAALCAFTDQEWPETRAEASDLIERIRIDIGHPAPALDDTPLLVPRRPRHRRRQGDPASWERIALAKETMAVLSSRLDTLSAKRSPESNDASRGELRTSPE